MKLKRFAILSIISVLTSAVFVNAQDKPTVVVDPSVSILSTATGTARILGKIPDGTPPLLAPPKPKFVISVNDILDVKVHQQGGRTITIQQIRPIPMPPPPQPTEVNSSQQDLDFSERVAEYRAAHPTHELLFLGATVFRSQDSPPRTLVHWWPQGGSETITFWSSADFALIAGGINSFVDTAGNTHSMLMGWGHVDIARMTELRAAKGQEYDAPVMPNFLPGNADFQIVGNQPAAEELAIIQSLHDIYNNDHARLLTAYAGREKARIAHEAYLKAHPPQPKDITLNYWRTEKPVANGKGATP